MSITPRTWLFCAFLLALSPVSFADFSGYYDVSNWTTTTNGTPPAGGSTIDTSGAPASITIVGGDDGCGSGDCTIDFTIPAQSAGTHSFDWDYATTDVDGPSFELFFVLNGATAVQLSDDAGSDTQSGSESVDVAAGDVIGFRLDCTDCSLGPADVTISNFSAPGNAVSVPALPTWALILMILLTIGFGYRAIHSPAFNHVRR